MRIVVLSFVVPPPAKADNACSSNGGIIGEIGYNQAIIIPKREIERNHFTSKLFYKFSYSRGTVFRVLIRLPTVSIVAELNHCKVPYFTP